MRSLRPFAVEFFKTTLNLPPGCKRWIISFMGRAHRPSAIRHSSVSALRPIRCRYLVTDVTMDAVRCNVTSGRARGEFPVFREYFETTRRDCFATLFRSSPIDISATTKGGKLSARDVDRRGARRRRRGSTGEKSRKSGAAVGAFIAYGSAKHLWNNGAAKYIVGEEKRKYLTRERTRKIGFYCSLPACRSVRMHVRCAYTLKSKIDTFPVSILEAG